MYIYVGKLNWLKYAVNEQFTIVLPVGFNLGDAACAFWQWTIDDKNNEKVNQKYIGTVSSVTASEDKVVLFGGESYYKFAAVRSKDYKTLTVTMSNKPGTTADATTLQLVYPSTPSLYGNVGCSIYTGKFDYHWYAENEMITIIVPGSTGFKIPICVVWQWTEDKDGIKKSGEAWVTDPIYSVVGGKTFSIAQDGYYSFDGEVTGDDNRKDEKITLTVGSKHDGLAAVSAQLNLVYHH